MINLFDDLENKMLGDYKCVNISQNPVLKNLSDLSSEQKKSILLQYIHFPKSIISIFVEAIYGLSYGGFDDLVKELRINIREELGESNDDANPRNIKKPHYTYLRGSIIENLEVDINKSQPTIETLRFIQNLKDIVNNDNPNFVSGAVYALECSAITELEIVKKMIADIIYPEIMSNELLHFFDSHIGDIEVGHKLDLQSNCVKYFSTDHDLESFENGFISIIEAMEKWWDSLININ